MKAIIIDDMELARESLKADLREYCHEIEIVGEAEGVVSAAKLLRDTEADLLFLDIHMQDGEGFDLLDILPDKKLNVIFTTASDEHAIRAFQYAAVDYLLKPIDPTLLKQAIAKISTNESFDVLHKKVLDEKERNSIVLSTAEEMRVVKIEHIIRCQSIGNYTEFYFKEDKKLLVTKTLKEYDRMLSDQNFIRVHQSHLVNLRSIKSYIKTEGGYLLLNDGSRVPVSVRKKPEVMKLVSQIN